MINKPERFSSFFSLNFASHFLLSQGEHQLGKKICGTIITIIIIMIIIFAIL